MTPRIWIYLSVLLTLSTTVLPGKVSNKVKSRGHNTSDQQGQCTLSHGGCRYRVVLADADCMPGDDPEPLENKYDTAHFKSFMEDHVGDYRNSVLSIEETKHAKEKEVEERKQEHEGEIKKLDELEKKLTKMMEGLSVRSLRHIRQIRNDLRQMTSTMNLIKQQGGQSRGGKSKRGLSCPAEFITVGTWQSCYRFSSFNTTWHEAREYCSAFGADLVSLDTLKESYILDYLIKSKTEFESAMGWWTSGNYIARNRRWMWTTKHHLKPMGFERWGPGEPNSRSTAHCLLLYKYANYMWHDGICSELHHFICEIELA